MPFLQKIFFDHPASVHESYWEHFASSTSFARRMLLGGIACMVHAIFPCFFVTTGSRQIIQLHDEMVTNRVRNLAKASSPAIEEG